MQVLSAPRQAFVPTVPTDVSPTVAATPIKYWIIAAVLGPIVLIILIILLIWWRWKKGAPKSKVEPDTIRMLETDKRKVSTETSDNSPEHNKHVNKTKMDNQTSDRTTYLTNNWRIETSGIVQRYSDLSVSNVQTYNNIDL